MRTRMALAAALLGAAPALAQLPAGSEFQVNTYTQETQYRPSAAILRGGEYVVVWDSMLQDGSWLGVYGQRFAPTGARIGAEFRVNTYTTDFQMDCHVAALPGGDSVVVFFSDQAPDGTYARLYDNTGTPRGPEFRVQTSAPYGLHPAVAADARGTFVVAWEGMGDGSERGVFARRFGRLGQPLGPEFLVNTYTTARQSAPEVAMAADGAFTIFWSSLLAAGTDPEVRGQRYDREGAPLGGEFAVNTYTTGWQYGPQADSDRAGNVIVAWSSLNQDGSNWGVYAQRYDAAGAALGGEFRVNVATADRQAFQTVASDGNFNFVVVWETGSYGLALRGRRYDSAGAPRGGEVPVGLPAAFQQGYPHVASDDYGNLVAAWYRNPTREVFAQRYGWVFPAALGVDPSASATSDGNGVLEPCETAVAVEPAWLNRNGAALTLSGSAPAYTGPPGPAYQLSDGAASYGLVAHEQARSCRDAGDCYAVGLPCPAARPAQHWDTALLEDLGPLALGNSNSWTLHVGDSFADVPRASPFYAFVETLVHHSITGGCGPSIFCPLAPTTREQMAVLLLVAKEAAGFVPPDCTIPLFADVPATSIYCRWIEEMARRGVVAGCGGGNYCPESPVTREQMAVFVLRTLDPALAPPACAAPMFADVPASSPFCRWIEELARRGIVTGCGGGNFCPTTPISREQVSVFITLAFGLTLY